MGNKKVFYIDLPDPNNIGDDSPFINVGIFETRAEAIQWAMDHLGTDEQGRLSVISMGSEPVEEEDEL